MPNHDGTGPDGKGPMTGWGRGYCVVPISGSEQELAFLTDQAQVLQKRLKQIRARMKRLESKEIAK
jgi:hypothetical protein